MPTCLPAISRIRIGNEHLNVQTRFVSCHLAIFQRITYQIFFKALKKNENNYKALFRKAKALGETGYFERAEKILEDIMKRNPAGALWCASCRLLNLNCIVLRRTCCQSGAGPSTSHGQGARAQTQPEAERFALLASLSP